MHTYQCRDFGLGLRLIFGPGTLGRTPIVCHMDIQPVIRPKSTQHITWLGHNIITINQCY
jgi:hypothetical protein